MCVCVCVCVCAGLCVCEVLVSECSKCCVGLGLRLYLCVCVCVRARVSLGEGAWVFLSVCTDVLHSNNTSGGYMDLDSAKAMQLLPCDFWVACSECGAETRFDGMRANTRADKSCHSCFAHLSFGFTAAVLEEVRVAASKGEGGGGRASVRDAAGKKVKMALPNGLLEGTPLPDKGACKHFRRSRRWLCFPCCGRAYPCPACHDEKVAGEHVAEWATRMICGYCSKEQPLSNKLCSCGGDPSGAYVEEFASVRPPSPSTFPRTPPFPVVSLSSVVCATSRMEHTCNVSRHSSHARSTLGRWRGHSRQDAAGQEGQPACEQPF